MEMSGCSLLAYQSLDVSNASMVVLKATVTHLPGISSLKSLLQCLLIQNEPWVRRIK